MAGTHGSGGDRVGSGRRPNDPSVAAVRGSRQRNGAKTAQGAPFPLLPAPSDLPADRAVVWNELAPLACGGRTLTAQTVPAFRDLCESIVLKRAMLAQLERDGLTYLKVTVDGAGVEHTELKAHPLVSQYRGMLQRVETGMQRFRLAPMGKELVLEVKDEDPFDAFDEGSVQ